MKTIFKIIIMLELLLLLVGTGFGWFIVVNNEFNSKIFDITIIIFNAMCYVVSTICVVELLPIPKKLYPVIKEIHNLLEGRQLEITVNRFSKIIYVSDENNLYLFDYNGVMIIKK